MTFKFLYQKDSKHFLTKLLILDSKISLKFI
jgi:hypothetical protein